MDTNNTSKKGLSARSGSAYRGNELSTIDDIRIIGFANIVPASSALLLPYLESRSPNVREEVVVALENIADKPARAGIRAALGDSNVYVRNRAVQSLGIVGNKSDVKRLIDILAHDDSWIVRSSAAESLGYLGHRTAIPILLERLRTDPHFIVRRDCACALGGFTDERIESDLNDTLATEPERLTAIAIHYALYRMGARSHLLSFLKYLDLDDVIAIHNVVNTIDITHLQIEDWPLAEAALIGLLNRLPELGFRTDVETLLFEIMRQSNPT